MKKYFLLFLMAIFAVSCSKKVEVKGKISGANPLERLEIIESSGVGTLPLVNLGLSNNGEFSGSFDAPKNGMYVISFAGKTNMIYLKKGQLLQLSGDAQNFPVELTITGDAKANNDFLKEAQKGFETYASKIQMNELIQKKEKDFIASFDKIKDDIYKLIEDNAKKFNATDDALQYKKEESLARLLGLLDGYEENHAMATTNPKFKVSEDFKKLKKKLRKYNNRLIRNYPMYREYQLNKLNSDFQKYVATLPQNPKEQPLLSEVFGNYLKTRKDLSSTEKNYFYAYVLAQSDLNFMNVKHYDKIGKLIDENITNSEIKKDLKALQEVLMGYKAGTKPNLSVMNKEGKSLSLSSLKGKPTLVLFYASWNPNIAMTTVPVLKEVTDFYKDQLNYAYVNLDDTNEQFLKTSNALLKGFAGTQYWVKGGINANAAKAFGLYGFKLPSYIILDKDGKLYGRPYFNLGDPELVEALSKLSGVAAPKPAPAPEIPQMIVPDVPKK